MSNEKNEQSTMLQINKRQKSFYESEEEMLLESKGNKATQIWRKMRRSQQRYREMLGIDELVYKKHWEWLGDLSDKKVLDLGCYSGNPKSLDIAKKSKSYLGIDLSEPAINLLKENLEAAQIPNARAESVDFLEADFQGKYKNHFDVIYAHSVAHHFKYFDAFLECVDNCLAEDGIVVTYDPLKTSLPIWALRTAYRPFQSDKDWEFPFSRKTFDEIGEYFTIKDLQGVMGSAKWGVPVYMLNKNLGERMGRKFQAIDEDKASRLGSGLWSCLQVTMCWGKKSRTTK